MSIIEGALLRAGIDRSPSSRIFHISAGDGNLNTALADCTADNGDIIVVAAGSHSVTEVVDFNVRGVTVVAADLGFNPTAQGERFTVNTAASYTDGPAAKITQPCQIIGLGFAGRQTAGESLLFDCEETGGWNAGFSYLLNCRFSCWYGAMTALIRSIGGQLNRIEGCTFDGLFGGVGDAGIILESDTGPIDPGFMQAVGNYFYGMGSGKHAIQHKSGDTPVSVLYHDNWLMAGFGAQGKFLDNNNCDSTGMASENHLAPLANQAAAFENMTNSTIGFANNHYEEA